MKTSGVAHILLLRLVILSLLASVVSADQQNLQPSSSITPKEHQRGPEQTFLTFPEWFLVHSPAEYATFVKDQPPSEFPFIGHIKQLWQSYGAVYGATKSKYPFNFGYHVMIVVISTSTTVEYLLRSGYETLIGRLSALTRTHGMTEEDLLAARVAQNYVDFIRVRPFYEYDFLGDLISLWKKPSFVGPDMLRKWERKYALTTEYLTKAIYGWFIKKATQASYDPALDVTAIVINRLPSDIDGELPQLKVLDSFSDGSALVTVPRYDAFKTYSLALAKRGIEFQEIAGNRSVILVSALVSREWAPGDDGTKVLFIQPILTQPSLKRVALVVSVAQLANLLRSLDDSGLVIEHVYDY